MHRTHVVVTDSYFFSHCLNPRFSSYYSHWNSPQPAGNGNEEGSVPSVSVRDPNRSVLDSTTKNHLPRPETCDWNDRKTSLSSMCDLSKRSCESSCSNTTLPCRISPLLSGQFDVKSTVIPPLRSVEEEVRIPEIDYEDNPFEGIRPTLPVMVKSKSLKNRINFASEKTGAVSLSKSKGMNSPGSVLTSNKYKYSLSECTRNKWFEFSLSEMVSVFSLSPTDRRRRHRRGQLRAFRVFDPRVRRLRQHRLPDAILGFSRLLRGVRQQRAAGVSGGRGDVDEVGTEDVCEIGMCAWSG